jgi:hypothetical protein
MKNAAPLTTTTTGPARPRARVISQATAEDRRKAAAATIGLKAKLERLARMAPDHALSLKTTITYAHEAGPLPAVVYGDTRTEAIKAAIGHAGWCRLFGGMGYPRRSRAAGLPEARTIVWRMLRMPRRTMTLSFPEIAGMTGTPSHSVVIESMRRTVNKSSLPAWLWPLWELAVQAGLTDGDIMPAAKKTPAGEVGRTAPTKGTA